MTAVTVLIAAYNAQATVARAVASALAQPEVAEVVVIDDASADHTITKAREADDGSGRLRILAQPINRGPSAARNRGIAESTAPWITVLDADDFYLPGRIAGLLTVASDGYDLIADDMYMVPEGQEEGPRRLVFSGDYAVPMDVDFKSFVAGNVSRRGRARAELGFVKPLIRRVFLEKHALRFQETMRLGEDYELYARVLAHGARMRLMLPQGYVAVVRPNSLSAKHSIEDLQALRDCDAALVRDFALTPLEREAVRQHYLSVDCRLQWRLLIEAVKKRNPVAGLKCFSRSLPVSLYLAAHLAAEVPSRLRRWAS